MSRSMLWQVVKPSVLFLLATVLLEIAYPWHIFYGNFHFSLWKTLISYLIVASLMTLLGGIVAPWLVVKFNLTLRSMAVALTTFVLFLATAAIFSGPGLFLDIPGTRVQGIFFAESQFVTFITYVALPFSLLAGAVCRLNVWMLGRF